MVRLAVAGRWIAMTGFDDLNFHLLGAGHGGIEVVEFEPEEHAIRRSAVMVLDVPLVQLEDQCATRNQSLIFRRAVRALATEEALVPSAASFDITHANEGLWSHTKFY
jgi:hypothetical protein